MGRIVMQDGEVIEDVKKVMDTHDGFLRVERFIKKTEAEAKPTEIVIEIISKERVHRLEHIKIWEGRGKL